MRRLVTLGVCSLLGGLAFTACGDDDDPPAGTGARGGTTASGGTGMGGARGGSGGAGGNTGGVGGSGGQTGEACPGCARITAPFTAAGQNANFQLYFNEPGIDLSAATITWHLRVNSFTGTSGGVQVYAQNNFTSAFPSYGFQLYTNLSEYVGDGFVDVTLDLAAAPAVAVSGDAGVGDAGDAGASFDPSVFDKSKVRIVGIQFVSGDAATGQATAVIDIDSVSFSTSAANNKTFTTEADVTALTASGALAPTGTTKVFVAQ